MPANLRARLPRIFGVIIAVVGTLGLVACGSSTSSTKVSGPVDVAYAGSLEKLVNSTLAPAFEKATGATFT
ncbi:MAG: hypothetical protein M3011_14025, partial [Actinomycetota bacterium]|nr:hypothetical protein [Actinomycetota bacterium]